MSPRATGQQGYLYDIIETARLIQQSTNDKHFDDYEADIGLQHQIERELMIIGEALARLKAIDVQLTARITGSDGYIGLRNILNHQYPNINHGTIWNTIKSEIPILIRESELLLSENL